ncbi:MAG: NAD(P)-dependent oxidoreductase [Bacilli bacterium]|jgi:dTDP-6-deoxy-L-talose 4-dehydrogenase (NAD+)|nr:NAD(P)-dependent oxidoreductase [Bacilli bacterium]
MKILITGANGYLGSKIVKSLCDLNHVVIATDLNCENIDSRAKFIKANIFEQKGNWFSYFDCPDVCLHLAWRDGFSHNSDKHMLDLSNHYNFCTNLIQNGLKQFSCMGTMHEVGYWNGAIDENTPCNPMSQYGIAKNALRKALELYCKGKNCNFLWLRAYYIFGDDSYGNSIFCKLRQAVKKGEKTFPFTTGKNKYDFIRDEMLVKQIISCITQSEVLGVVNVCSGEPESLAKKIEWYISINNLPIKLEYGKYPDRPYDSPCIYGDNTKINTIMERNK